MKVNDILNMLFYSAQYELIGAETGKKLYKSWINTNIDKYKDLDVSPKYSISPAMRIRNDSLGIPQAAYPILLIYVTGL